MKFENYKKFKPELDESKNLTAVASVPPKANETATVEVSSSKNSSEEISDKTLNQTDDEEQLQQYIDDRVKELRHQLGELEGDQAEKMYSDYQEYVEFDNDEDEAALDEPSLDQ
jgi:hypothetical protein